MEKTDRKWSARIADCMNTCSELQAKASAYDRLMTGGLSMKELANILKHPVAIDNDDNQNQLYYFSGVPHLGQYSDGTSFWSCAGARTKKMEVTKAVGRLQR